MQHAEGSGEGSTIDMRLVAIRLAAHDTNLYEFERLDGRPLPAVAPGSHVDIHLPNGMVRPYSLVASGEAPASYVIGVKRDAAGRGGSVAMHDTLRVGTMLKVGRPRNNFPLEEGAPHSVLIAGGIGITPIWCMAQRLIALGQSFEIHYACRDRRDVAFARELEALGAHLHIDSESAGRFLDIAGIVAAAPDGAHFYCCGPAPMLTGFEAATAALPAERVHLERFAAAPMEAPQGGFVVALQASGKEFVVPEGKSILEVLREQGLDVDFSCEQGICGACRVTVLEGEPDHRDMVLSEREKAQNDAIMVCCSGSKSPRLVLAL
ncbi:PDR/VanB family oxidoreductase [Ancylobacter polymorphus]|jgi:ferredoxin-NADP reductase|uniref:Ferredoxin-NADP reductase n=1 Tax=Ancylobacter polymorphus TaxID=223390 RepID=A0ABU0BIR3_9HYPH|nr:PDR/VanB family oxidoreductase [Ancylobacter polymorphus]MDQ0304942.1 ferredoxin-NADP reductase [Ancylobacter polymorphus]